MVQAISLGQFVNLCKIVLIKNYNNLKRWTFICLTTKPIDVSYFNTRSFCCPSYTSIDFRHVLYYVRIVLLVSQYNCSNHRLTPKQLNNYNTSMKHTQSSIPEYMKTVRTEPLYKKPKMTEYSNKPKEDIVVSLRRHRNIRYNYWYLCIKTKLMFNHVLNERNTVSQNCSFC